MVASLGARLDAAKEVVNERHKWWSWAVILLITCEVLAALLMVSYPAWATSPWATLAWALPVTYLLAAERSESWSKPLEEPLTLLVPSSYSLYGLGRRQRSAFAPRCFGLLRSTVLIVIMLHGSQQSKVFDRPECCSKLDEREMHCQQWGTEGLPSWAPCGSVDPKCYQTCREDLSPAWFLGGFCNVWLGLCHSEDDSIETKAAVLFGLLPIGGGCLEFLLVLLFSLRGCVCVWCLPQNLDLQAAIDLRAEEIDREVEAGQRQPSKMILLEGVLYYADILLDLNSIAQYAASANGNFAYVAGIVWIVSMIAQCREGGPISLAAEVCKSYRRGLPTDLYVRTLASERRSEAVPTLMLQWYAFVFVVEGDYGAISLGLSLLSGLRGVVLAAHQDVHLGVDTRLNQAGALVQAEGSYVAVNQEASTTAAKVSPAAS